MAHLTHSTFRIHENDLILACWCRLLIHVEIHLQESTSMCLQESMPCAIWSGGYLEVVAMKIWRRLLSMQSSAAFRSWSVATLIMPGKHLSIIWAPYSPTQPSPTSSLATFLSCMHFLIGTTQGSVKWGWMLFTCTQPVSALSYIHFFQGAIISEDRCVLVFKVFFLLIPFQTLLTATHNHRQHYILACQFAKHIPV